MEIENLLSVKDGYNTDKLENRFYLKRYDRHFRELKSKNICLLELGVKKGGSLLLWKDYFKKSKIVGLDFDPLDISIPKGVHFFQGLQQDFGLLDKIRKKVSPEGFDIIIDDCSHIGEITKMSFWHLFNNHLNSGGIYVIEDWGTGYWGNYSDGKRYPNWKNKRDTSFIQKLFQKLNTDSRSNFARYLSKKFSAKKISSHQYGMVGFLKQLIDECALEDITKSKYGTSEQIQSTIDDIHVSLGQAFIYKK